MRQSLFIEETFGLGHPVDPAAAQVTAHLLGVARHQDAAFGDADIAHPRDHVVQQRLELFVVRLGVVADAAEDQDALIARGVGRDDGGGEQGCADRGQRQAEPGCTQR